MTFRVHNTQADLSEELISKLVDIGCELNYRISAMDETYDKSLLFLRERGYGV